MADGTGIEWVRAPDGRAGATWNVITGCKVKSPGCVFCYAMREAGAGRVKNHPSRIGLTREVNGHHVWTGEVRFNEAWLDQPLQWRRPRDIFVVAHGDLFYEKVPDGWIMRLLHVMGQCPQHRFRILTKRPDRARDFLARWADLSGEDLDPKLVRGPAETRTAHPSGRGQLVASMLEAMGDPPAGAAYPTFDWQGGMKWWPDVFSNVWIGASVERQQEADERRVALASIAALGWNTWVSYEPALGPVDWSGWEFVRWMVSGGESSPRLADDVRPSHLDWHRATRDWCASNSIPYFFKQWGNWAPHRPAAGGDLGGDVRRGRVTIVHPTGQSDVEVFMATGINTIPGSRYMARVGKKAAGALLDGVGHTAMPL